VTDDRSAVDLRAGLWRLAAEAAFYGREVAGVFANWLWQRYERRIIRAGEEDRKRLEAHVAVSE
jgi:hypothetical protein